MSCPNKNTAEWKTLVSKVGEKGAMSIFMANNNNLPPLSDIDNFIESYKFNQFHRESFDNVLLSPLGSNLFEDYEEDYDGNLADMFQERESEDSNLRRTAFGDATLINVQDQYVQTIKELYYDVRQRIKIAKRNGDYIKEIKLNEELKMIMDRLEIIIKTTNPNNLKDFVESINHFTLWKQYDKDLEIVNNILNKPFLNYGDMKAARILIDYWTNVYERSIYDENIVEFRNLRSFYNKAKEEFEILEARIQETEKRILDKQVQETANDENFDLVEYLRKMQDFGKFTFLGKEFTILSKLFHLGRFDNKILNHVNHHYAQSTQRAKIAFEQVRTKNRNLSEKAFKELKKLGYKDWKDVFIDRDDEGYSNGDLISPYLSIYNSGKKLAEKTIEDEPTVENVIRFINFINNNDTFVDPNIFFFDAELNKKGKGLTQEKIDKIKEKELERLSGLFSESQLNNHLKSLEKEVNKYKNQRKIYKESLENSMTDIDTIAEMLNDFDEQFSPYRFAELLYTPNLKAEDFKTDAKGNPIVPQSYRTVVSSPSKNSPMVNSKFSTIQENETLLEYWLYKMELIQDSNAVMPGYITTNLRTTSLPYVKKEIRERFSELGLMGVVHGSIRNWYYDKLASGRQPNSSPNLDFAGREKLRLTPNGYQSIESEINYIRLLKLRENAKLFKELKKENKYKEQKELEEKILKEAEMEVMAKQSFDLPMLMEHLAVNTLLYKEKLDLEPLVLMVDRMIENQLEPVYNDQQNIVEENGAVKKYSKQESYVAMKEAYKFFVKHNFYDKSLDETKADGKVYNYDEKMILNKLEKAIKEAKKELKNAPPAEQETKTQELEKRKLELDQAKMTLGAYSSGRKLFDFGLAYLYLTSLGYNIVSGFSNAYTALIGNIRWSAANHDIKEKYMARAILYSLQNTLDLFSLGASSKIAGNKPTALMQKLAIFNSNLNEIQKKGLKDKSWFDRLSPFKFMESGEYLAQVQLMLAKMFEKNYDIEYDVDGETKYETVNMYDMFDNDGNIKEQYQNILTLEELGKFSTNVREIASRTHGNYSDTLKIPAKKNMFLSLVLMFRHWSLENYKGRLEEEHYDEILGRTVKGTWRSTFDLYNTPNLADAIAKQHPNMNKMQKLYVNLLAKQNQDKWESYGKMGKIGIAAKSSLVHLINFAFFTTNNTINTIFRTNLTEILTDKDSNNIDYQNIRMMYRSIQIYALLHLLIAGIRDDDDEEKYARKIRKEMGKSNALYYGSLNFLTRLKTEQAFYWDPRELGKIINSPIAAMRYVDVMDGIYVGAYKTMTGDPTYQRGRHEGQNRLKVATLKAVPIGSQVNKTYGWLNDEFGAFGQRK